MFQTRLKCPHCNNLADFALTEVAEFRITAAVPSKSHFQRQVVVREVLPAQRVDAYGVASCPLCHGPVLMQFKATFQQMQGVHASVRDLQQRYSAKDIEVVAIHPQPREPARDAAYPEEVREIFAEAQEDLAMNRSPARIVATCRSVLDVCTKKLDGVGDKLSSRINDLKSKGVLTGHLADWAHSVRMDGNEAIHDLKASPGEAYELVEFIKTFLDVAFVLPAKITEKRNRQSEERKPIGSAEISGQSGKSFHQGL
jgi:hypothetical protein